MRVKRFSNISGPLDFSKVIAYLRNYKDLPFGVLYRNNAYGTGVTLEEYIVEDPEEIKDVLNTLLNLFKFQFVGGYSDNRFIKFNLSEFLNSIKKGSKIELVLQPTTKIKADKFTEFKPNRTLFHISDVSNQDSILKYGLIPKGRSYGEKGYNYPNCIHLLTDLFGLVQLKNGKLTPGNGWRTNNIILFEVTPPKENQFLLDPVCDFGVITYNPIPKENIRLVPEEEYKKVFKERSFPMSVLSKKIKFIKIKDIII